jgi:hypothetical protein
LEIPRFRAGSLDALSSLNGPSARSTRSNRLRSKTA